MVASYSSASPSSWRPTARTLGALFAGSAVTLSATVLHGGSLLLAGGEAESVTEPSASLAVAEPQQLPPTNSTASLSSPGQAAPWTPGAAPQWGSSLRDLPVRRAPVQEAPRQDVHASTASASAGPAGSGTSTAGPRAPHHDADGASTGNAGFGGAAPQTADRRQGGSFDGLLSSVFHVTKGLPH
jgi:hypothetical protein